MIAFTSLLSERQKGVRKKGRRKRRGKKWRVEGGKRNSLSKFRLMEALLSPSSFLAVTLYLPASSIVTFMSGIVT